MRVDCGVLINMPLAGRSGCVFTRLSVTSCVILLFVERLEVGAVFHVTWSPQGGKVIKRFFDCLSVNISALNSSVALSCSLPRA